jgi:hypothetical protein
MRPLSIHEVERSVGELARFGGVLSDTPYAAWLRLVGAVQDGPHSPWLYTDLNWLTTATPASGPLDLLRRTAIRDPQYRFHLDLILTQVLQAVGTAARWIRFENLLFGPLMHFAPRFVQLLEFAAAQNQDKSVELPSISWERLAQPVEGRTHETFEGWDRELWGDVPGGPAAIFPLLVDLYVPLRRQLCNVAAEEQALDDASTRLLAAMVERSGHGEGVPMDPEFESALKTLLNLGLPIRRWATSVTADRRNVVGLVEPIRLVWGGTLKDSVEGIPITGADKASLKNARHDQPTTTSPTLLTDGFWTAIEHSVSAVAFPGLCLAESWPAIPAKTPIWAEVPPSTAFRAVEVVRKDSLEVDQALFVLARHVLFGLLLQVLLLESLDRELGQDTLALTPAIEDGTGDFRDVRIFYRPAQEQVPEAQQSKLPAYDLGAFDAIVNSIASVLGIMPAGLTFEGDGNGFWSAGMSLLGSLGLITLSRSRDRWILHIDFLDRLHGGGLMAGVLRRGKNVRDRIRTHLQHLWSAANDVNQRSGLPDA